MNKLENKSMPTNAANLPEPECERLALINNLLNTLHHANVRYCHWKSNEHLQASMLAETDLDVLFDYKEKEKLLLILGRLGFRKFEPVRQKRYPDIEDFIGLDFLSGRVVHLHAHFRLTLGEAYLKSYQLPLTDELLDSRIYNRMFGIYTIHPAAEYILLMIRQALKIRTRDVVRSYLKKLLTYTGNIRREYEWLKARCTAEEVEEMLQNPFGMSPASFAALMADFSPAQVVKFAPQIKEALRASRMLPALQARMTRWYHEGSLFVIRKAAKWLGRPMIKQRINPRGGLSVALIGADGSGKSTIIKELQSTFSKKIDVHCIYFGMGSSGNLSWSRRILQVFTRQRTTTSLKINKDREARVGKKSLKRMLFEFVQALLLADEKQRKLKQMHQVSRKGALVICDRFPQNQFMGYNDGPLLSGFARSKNILFRKLSHLEAGVFAKAEHCPPDIVFKLITDAGVAAMRKPHQTSARMLQTKIKGILQVQFKKPCKVIEVDASQPLEKVLYVIKKEIWQAMP